ncbi:MAG: hypothetical protein ACUVTP_10540 [Candidatus Fervidibacter sp.]|uniref:hypothetical protein n=1 Tax=Candidatus Fervidibacter sp. TaxID=3100871 RepID=UPI004049BB0D
MVRKAQVVVLCLPLLLVGCVEVEVKVSGLGKVTQTFTATVSQRASDVLKAAAQNYLGRNWEVVIERKGEMNIVRIWRSFSPRNETKPMPGVNFEFRRRNGWFRASYELKVRYNPAELLQTKDEQAIAANKKVVVRVFMPGRIIPEQSTVTSVDGNAAEFDFDPLNRMELKIVAVGVIWWRIGLLLLVLAALIWFIAPYIPRVVDKVRRPTVKVVQR